ncbi:hypothetical protein LPJ61_005503 [Coemansia biformis]|uniref:ABC transporter domain-containing protein n=1 Tax=Coemansia biformis TaxID=1286918 RepID=A0A9W7Y8P9_9FUNG|nr:hypothetical protein LPJ61_005503 [Coemansia biformis]
MAHLDTGAAPTPGGSAPILSWSNLNYDVKVNGGVRRILHDISGAVYPGELVAIMGSSGAGKTTLMNVLSGRVQGGKLHGEINFMGAKRDPHSFKRMLAFVEQDDLMYPTLTVEETLRTSAQLRLPDTKYTRAEKEARVESVLRQLRLSRVKDSMIGGNGMRGVSGGERKRVSIGAELVTDPSILVLDEPSSGLDSSSAEMVISLTKEMSHERNLCTLMTIHQPSAEMVAQFDKLILLAQGKLVYIGPAKEALPYFENLGFPPTNPNPANFFIDLMTVDFSSTEAMHKSEARVQSLVDNFADFRERRGRILPSQKEQLDSAVTTGNGLGDGAAAAANAAVNDSASASIVMASSRSSKDSHADSAGITSVYNAAGADITREAADLVLVEPPPLNSWVSEVLVLLRRDWIMTIRSRSFINGLIVQCLAMLIFVGFVFFQLKHDQQSVQNRVGVLYTLILLSTFPVVIPVMTIIMAGRSVLFRERSGGTYRMTAYFLARGLSFFPVIYVPYIIMFTGVYFISHLQYDAGKFFIAFAILAVLLFASLGFAFSMAMIVDRMEVAHTIAPVTLATLMLFGGNLSNANSITPVLRWIKYICIFYYPYSALMQNEFDGLAFTCGNGKGSCYTTGSEVIHAYGLDELSIHVCVIICLSLGIAFYIFSYGLLRWAAKPRFLWI